MMKEKVGCFINLFCLAAFVFSGCDDVSPVEENVANTNSSASTVFSFRIGVANQSLLRVGAINGSVEISGVATTDSVIVTGIRKVESESVVDAREHLAELSVQITEGASEIVVETEQPEQSFGRNYVVEYDIRVPDSWQLAIVQANGDITVSSMEDNVAIALANGDVAVDSTNGDVEVALANGAIRLWDISGSVGGVVANGEIDSKILLPVLGTCNLETANGMIDLLIPITTTANFSARVSNGTITVSNLTLQNENVTPSLVTGRLGSGEGQIDLESGNGNIVVTGF